VKGSQEMFSVAAKRLEKHHQSAKQQKIWQFMVANDANNSNTKGSKSISNTDINTNTEEIKSRKEEQVIHRIPSNEDDDCAEKPVKRKKSFTPVTSEYFSRFQYEKKAPSISRASSKSTLGLKQPQSSKKNQHLLISKPKNMKSTSSLSYSTNPLFRSLVHEKVSF
jgi:hypothetical protein